MLGLEPGWGASPRRGTGPGSGGDGGYSWQCGAYCADAPPPRPVCDQACLQAKWVQHNALTPLARPPLTASITQAAQLDARRNKAERNVEAQTGKEDLQGVTTAFEGQNAETSTAPGQGGSGGGGVPPAPPGCPDEGPTSNTETPQKAQGRQRIQRVRPIRRSQI